MFNIYLTMFLKIEIAKKYLIPRALNKNGLYENNIKYND